jgi:membrane associated rhomboid family serine protease
MNAFPPGVKHLLIINGLFAFAQTTPLISSLLDTYLILYPMSSGLFYPWQLVSYMFLHGGFGHLFFNLFALWMFGQQIEHVWGTRRFVSYYLLSGVGAAFVHLLVSGSPVIGASGGVFGILLAYGMMFPNRRILLLIPPVPIPAKFFVAGYGALELLNGLSASYSGVAHFAHLGGMLAGFLLIRYWRLPIRVE